MSDRTLLSVIIPVYNVEQYLEEALESVIHQDIGFEENIQLILVNDGSPDDSGKICEKYSDKYSNIIYIAQENQGVSAARNRGLEAALGKYIAFFDPDDKLSLDAYRLTIDFFENHYNEIDIASFKMKFFERLTGDHPLNYRFNQTKVIDVREYPTYMQSSGVSCIFKATVFKNRRFDPSIKYAEDMKLINEIILDKMAYGVVRGPIYYVRKRLDESSASNNGHMNPEYYTVTPERVFKHLFDLWESRNGVLDEFIQFVVLFDLQWRINQKTQLVLTAKQEEEYRQNIRMLAQRITNDELILKMPKMKVAFKVFLLKEKYGNSAFADSIRIKNGEIWLKNTNINKVLGYSILPRVGIDKFEYIDGNMIRIEGHVSGMICEEARLKLVAGSSVLSPEFVEYRIIGSRNVFLGQQVDINRAFTVKVDLNSCQFINYSYELNGQTGLLIVPGIFSGLSRIKYGHKRLGSKLIINTGTSLLIRDNSLLNRIKHESLFSYKMLKMLKMHIALSEFENSINLKIHDQSLSAAHKLLSLVRPFLIPVKASVINILSLALRLIAKILKSLKTQEVWIITDRINSAGDNGEAFYDYVAERNPDTKIFFAVNKDSKAYKRLLSKKYNLIDMSSVKYKLGILVADKVISSNADDKIINPFLGNWSKFIDLMDYKFVFLQHGVIKDDLSSMYNYWNTRIEMFVTTTPQEYDSIVSSKSYGFGEDIVKLTGLPRFDLLSDSPSNVVSLVPTWRRGLDGGLDKFTGDRMYSDRFKETAYFKFYNKLINDTRIGNALERYGFEAKFYIHPSLSAQAVDFSNTGIFKVMQAPYSFDKIFSESKLLITDYSSVAFDFAYLRKPVLYTQFDKEDFFKNHTYKQGYYNYEKDGFGPVVYDYESTVNTIIMQLKRGCRQQKKYKDRIERTFIYNDKQNSERVFKEIISMPN